MLGIGVPELAVIFLIVFLLFGAKNLPEIAQSLGKSIKMFKKGIQKTTEEVKSVKDDLNQDLEKKNT